MPYTVEWSSMAETFHERDFIIVDKITPKYGTLKRWDIIVFIPPWKDIPFIKRIVGMPWDTITLQWWKTYICKSDKTVKDNTATDNTATTDKSSIHWCTLLQEPYLWSDTSTEARCGVSSFDVIEWYFVMGDNRWFSTDSRCCFGLWCVSGSQYTVTTDHIIGKVFGRIYPDPTIYNTTPLQ